jgi:hypothetical protein
MRNSDNDVSRRDARGHESKPQRVRAAVHADTAFRIAKLREFALELVDHWTTDKTCRIESLFHDGKQFGLEFLVRPHKVKEGNI